MIMKGDMRNILIKYKDIATGEFKSTNITNKSDFTIGIIGNYLVLKFHTGDINDEITLLKEDDNTELKWRSYLMFFITLTTTL